MGTELQLALRLPSELAAAVISREAVRTAIAKTPDVRVERESSASVSPVAFRDFGATIIAILGTAAAAAAVKGFFKVVCTVVKESYEIRKLRMKQEHELRIAEIQVGSERREILLDGEWELIEAEIIEIETEAIGRL